MKQYIQYKDTKYIILMDGRVARLLKPTKIHHQHYFNFIINGKQERVNSAQVSEMFDAETGRFNNAANAQTEPKV